MKLRALSKYNGDGDTRYGDCILIYNSSSLIVFDCGHNRHAEAVESFLEKNYWIKRIYIVISHNDKDHIDGIANLMEYLYDHEYDVTVYTSLYLKNTKEIMDILDDQRRTSQKTREHILEMFENICEVVQQAETYGFSVENAKVNTRVSTGTIVGPTVEEFAKVVAAAVESGDPSTKIDGETVMNAASIQLKIKLESADTVLLCGDATPEYLHNLDMYDIIQLPHHGKLESAQKIFETLEDSYSKVYLVSDNTGAGENSGGSDKLVKYMEEEKYAPAKNTKNEVVNIPNSCVGNVNESRRVKLGEVDCKCIGRDCIKHSGITF